MSAGTVPEPAPGGPGPVPALRLREASLAYGSRRLWSGLDLDVAPGEFVAVLGANGAGKSSLLRVVLGQQPLQAGRVEVAGRPARRGDRNIGYVPQQKGLEPSTPLRARDFVRLGLDGHRWGPLLPSRSARAKVDAVLEAVGATSYADVPVGRLSGGEQQRLRVAQSIVGEPRLLLADEPLLSLDLHHAGAVSALVDQCRTRTGAAVLFVTHDVNPVLPYTDRVLYLAGGRFRIGTPEQVMNSATLSELYGAPVEVLESGGRLLVAGGGVDDHQHAHQHERAS
ncbi:metal ABC transporter ATP-binding protein [Kineococcus sp. SYSU DK006]|uniref:metal ABC transporter ATP-binding protein n=1 Tax=Kineococcus sp. SYSU DK006 TaxID=3383127 RepID=UPI003D7EDE32